MRDFPITCLSTDLLDHLVLDTHELEDLAERLVPLLQSADLEGMPKGRVAVQLMDLLFRLKEVSGALQCASGHQIRRVADALSSDPVDEHRPGRQHGDHVLVGADDGGEPITRYRHR